MRCSYSNEHQGSRQGTFSSGKSATAMGLGVDGHLSELFVCLIPRQRNWGKITENFTDWDDCVMVMVGKLDACPCLDSIPRPLFGSR